MISAVMSVRDRDKARIVRCIDSIKDLCDEIIVVDYGSKKPLVLKDAKVIRYDKNPIWNKSHALNLGIKASKGDYIMTIDCDMLLTKKCIKRIRENIGQDKFIVNTNVWRLEIKDLNNKRKAKMWFDKDIRQQIYSKANGGIQIFSRKWIEKVKGYDEELILWGAIDNDLYERAFISGLTIVNLNTKFYHQEHRNKKENNLPENERWAGEKVRMEKATYLKNKIENRRYVNNGPWGTQRPHQSYFEKRFKILLKTHQQNEKDRLQALETVKKKLMNKGVKFLNIGGEQYEVFR